MWVGAIVIEQFSQRGNEIFKPGRSTEFEDYQGFGNLMNFLSPI